MVTSPVKLYRLLPTPTPPHYDPDFKFQPRGRHGVLKHGRQVYIPPLPAPTGTNVLHFDMNFCSPPMPLAALSGLPLWFPWRECAHFLLGSLNMPCSIRCLGYKVTLLPSLLGFFSVIPWLSSDATGCPSVFYKRSRKNIPWPTSKRAGRFPFTKRFQKIPETSVGNVYRWRTCSIWHSRPIHTHTPFTVRCISRQNTKWRHNCCYRTKS